MSLIHRLLVGHFDLSAQPLLVCSQSIDTKRAIQFLVEVGGRCVADGQYDLNGEIVYIRDGYVSFPWLSWRTNELAVSVAEKLARDQGAILAEERGLRGPLGNIYYPPELATERLR